MSQPLIPPRDKEFRIADYEPGRSNGLSRLEAEQRIVTLRRQIDELQDLFYADGRFAMLIILQGIDTSGKDGTIRSVFSDADPLNCNVIGFGVPSEEERDHDYLWRCHSRLPRKGNITIFNRSYYEDVLVVRVKNLAQEERWKKRYDHINDFERMLADEGTVILKFFLHISKDEQRERLQARVDDPTKQWKFRAGDLDDRKLWDDFQKAFEDAIDRCNTAAAPWHVVPANHKWYRDVVIAEAVVAKLESLGLRYPPAEPGVAGTKVV
ncbi:MAG: PPK2 family polyphosphate kinase [Dehalococcoidia bacterium]